MIDQSPQSAEQPANHTSLGRIKFGLPVSGWFRLFDDTGFDVLDFIEIQGPTDAEGERFGVPASWARRYPSEQVWKVRKRTS